jgi:riboflavin transporter FmnP
MLKIIINESQKKLIVESLSENMKSVQDEALELTKKVVSDTYEQTGVNLSMLLTWGASIGGLISPVTQWLQGQNPELSESDISLIMTSIICVIFYENKETLGTLLKHLKERKLIKYFKMSLEKTKELQKTFISFLKSLNIVSFNVLNMLSYSFLVPLLPLIYDMASQRHFDMSDVEMITKSIVSYGLITMGRNLLKQVIEKIINRFSS